MQRWQIIKVVGASLLLGACVGGIDPSTGDPGGDDDGSGDGADVMFGSLQSKLSGECGACHSGNDLADTATGPDFLGPVGSSATETLAILLAYESATGGPIVGATADNSKLYFYGQHTGPALSAGLAADVEAWIAQENLENPKDPGDPNPDPDPAEPASLVEALEMFGNCMLFTDFEATQFENVADQNTADGQCSACHNAGTGGAYLAQDNIAFYTGQREMPYILKFVTGTVNTDGSFRDLVMSRRYELKRDDNGHPNYIMAPERLQAVEQFYQLTYQHYRTSIDTNTPCTPDTPIPQ